MRRCAIHDNRDFSGVCLCSEIAEERRIAALPGKEAWQPAYKVPSGTKARHAEAYRVRAGQIGALAMCICTWPLDIEPDTKTGHSKFCPTEMAAKETTDGHV